MIENISPCERISHHLFHLLQIHMMEIITACKNLFHSQTKSCYSFYQTLRFLELKYLSAIYWNLNIVIMEILVLSTFGVFVTLEDIPMYFIIVCCCTPTRDVFSSIRDVIIVYGP